MYKLDFENSNDFCGLEYQSPAEMEASVSDDRSFKKYYFGIYRCSPDEKNEINILRVSVKEKYPDLVIPVGAHFILSGKAACKVLSSYYYSRSLLEDQPQIHAAYYKQRYESVAKRHDDSQSLPKPINLTEGQLATDFDSEFYIKIAVLEKRLTLWKI